MNNTAPIFAASIAGFLASLSLILAIGAQNAFVLRQGLRGEYVTAIVLFCALSDAALIAFGVYGFRLLGPVLPGILAAMRWAGVGFLFIYGALRFRSAYQGSEKLLPANSSSASLAKILAICAVMTWANPHVYLDTVMFLGSISAQYHPDEFYFGVGAALGSFVFFSSLGYGARLLAPVLASIRAWIILEIVIGLTMWSIAFGLIAKVQ